MAVSGFLFDLDGTLVDSNRAHVSAWLDALAARGYRVAAGRVVEELGKGGDRMVTDLLGREAEAKDGEALRTLHREAFASHVAKEGLLPAPGGRALLLALRERGFRLALATSSSEEELTLTERASGVPWRVLFDEVVDGGMVASTKPCPDLISRAAQQLRLHPAQCVLIGDTPWDAEAAGRAGAASVGVCSGGRSAEALRAAGARVVYRDLVELAEELDDALRRISPGSLRLDASMLGELMRHALAAAEEAMLAGEVPVGAILARGDGTVIGHGFDRANSTRDRVRHAALEAFAAAAGKLPRGARDAILVTTVEPCAMCAGAAVEMSLDVVVYGAPAPKAGGSRRVAPSTSPTDQTPRFVGGVLAPQCRALLLGWLERPKRNLEQEPAVRRLLEPLDPPTR